jgi:FkbM family methyltransferase
MPLRLRVLLLAWPLLWPAIRAINAVLPTPLQKRFENVVFWRPWNKWYRHAYEPDLRDVFFEHIVTFFYRYPIRRGDTVVHVGASFGEETSRFVRAVGKCGRVFAIEPEARNVEVMRAILPPRPCPHLVILQLAASNTTADTQLLVGGGKEHRLAHVTQLGYEWWGVTSDMRDRDQLHATPVKADTLDNILGPYTLDKIDFILVETNGSELEVVQGLDKLMPIVERLGVRGHVLRDGAPISVAIDKVLREKGFDTFTTSEGMVLAAARPR